MKNPAQQWLDQEISIGKLLEIKGVPRPAGDDLAGAFWHAICEKVNDVRFVLQNKLAFAEESLAAATALNKQEDITAESASRLAYITALSELQLHFGVWMDERAPAAPVNYEPENS